MGIMEHIGHSVETVSGIGVGDSFALRRCAVAKKPCHVIIVPIGLRVEFQGLIGAEIMAFRDFQIIPTVNRHGIIEVGRKTMCFKENA